MPFGVVYKSYSRVEESPYSSSQDALQGQTFFSLFPDTYPPLALNVGRGELTSKLHKANIRRRLIAMQPSAPKVRRQIEDALAERIPSALTPSLRPDLPVAPTGIRSVDQYLNGGFPIGAITELVGPECSGRTSLAFSFLAQRTQHGSSCAWIDVSDTFDPESAAANGIQLERLLWVRCANASSHLTPMSKPFHKPVNVAQYKVPPVTMKGLHGGGCGGHPRSEVTGLSQAVKNFVQPGVHTEHPLRHSSPVPPVPQVTPSNLASNLPQPGSHSSRAMRENSPMAQLDRALRVADLLLQAGGFTAITIDAASILPEHISRVPLATWFRYRAAAERAQTSLLLLTQHPSCKSSAELVLNLNPAKPLSEETTVFTGIQCKLSISRWNASLDRQRVIPLNSFAKSTSYASWISYASWGTFYEAIP